MRARLFQNPTSKPGRFLKSAYELKFDIADMLLLSVFGFVAIRHIIKDGEKQRLLRMEMQSALKKEQDAKAQTELKEVSHIIKAIEFASFNGCDCSESSMSNSRRLS